MFCCPDHQSYDCKVNKKIYVEGALFAINSNESSTTKYSRFYLMCGRNPRLPFEAEESVTHSEANDDIAQLMEDLSSEVAIRTHVRKCLT